MVTNFKLTYMRLLLFLILPITLSAQTNTTYIRSKVNDSTTITAPPGYGVIAYQTQNGKWVVYENGIKKRLFGSGGGTTPAGSISTTAPLKGGGSTDSNVQLSIDTVNATQPGALGSWSYNKLNKRYFTVQMGCATFTPEANTTYYFGTSFNQAANKLPFDVGDVQFFWIPPHLNGAKIVAIAFINKGQIDSFTTNFTINNGNAPLWSSGDIGYAEFYVGDLNIPLAFDDFISIGFTTPASWTFSPRDVTMSATIYIEY